MLIQLNKAAVGHLGVSKKSRGYSRNISASPIQSVSHVGVSAGRQMPLKEKTIPLHGDDINLSLHQKHTI